MSGNVTRAAVFGVSLAEVPEAEALWKAAPDLLATAKALSEAIDRQYDAEHESYFDSWPEKHALDAAIRRAQGGGA